MCIRDSSKSDDPLEELLLLTEQMQEERDQKDRTIRERKMQLDESLTLNERLNIENRAGTVSYTHLYKEAQDKNRVYYEYYHLDGTEEIPVDYKEISFVCLSCLLYTSGGFFTLRYSISLS